MATKRFALRLAPLGIGVFEVRPGIIRTPMTEPVAGKYDQRLADGLVPMGRWGQPQDVARACETGIAEIQFLGLFVAACGGILRLSSTTDQRQQAQGMSQLKIGIAGCGAIGLASAAWMAERGNAVRLWSPRDPRPQATVNGALTCNGVLVPPAEP